MGRVDPARSNTTGNARVTIMNTRDMAIAYFDAWQTRDLDRFRALLADDVTWEWPTWRAGNADECRAAFQRASSVVTRVDIQHLWVDGADAVTWCTASPHPNPNKGSPLSSTSPVPWSLSSLDEAAAGFASWVRPGSGLLAN